MILQIVLQNPNIFITYTFKMGKCYLNVWMIQTIIL